MCRTFVFLFTGRRLTNRPAWRLSLRTRPQALAFTRERCPLGRYEQCGVKQSHGETASHCRAYYSIVVFIGDKAIINVRYSPLFGGRLFQCYNIISDNDRCSRQMNQRNGINESC